MSGRIVVEFDSGMKKRLYAALSLDGTTLKDWFHQRVEEYLAMHQGLTRGIGDASPRMPRKKKQTE